MSAAALRPAPVVPPEDPPARSRRGRRLPHATMPVPAERRRLGALLSMAVHVALIMLIAYDFVPEGRSHIDRILQGAGGPGPAGGGGGGNGGTGGRPPATREHLDYVRVAPAPPPPPVAVVQPTPTPVVPPVIPPLVTPKPQPTQAPVPTASASATTDVASAVPGTGGGTGTDGTAGSGPGSGGGVGSGIGTGRGSGTGPGTGGGTQANYPPTPTEMFLPPMPVPSRVRGFHLIAEFEVDTDGRVLGMTFTETRDGDYNRKIRDILKSIRFRPGTTPAGAPVRMKAQLEYTFY